MKRFNQADRIIDLIVIEVGGDNRDLVKAAVTGGFKGRQPVAVSVHQGGGDELGLGVGGVGGVVKGASFLRHGFKNKNRATSRDITNSLPVPP